MLNFPPLRSQADGLSDEASLLSGIEFDPANDQTRQEFAADLDINRIVQRFGNLSTGVPPRYEEQDYTADLQQALTAVAQARAAFQVLPKALREKYKTWRDLLQGIDEGAVTAADLAEPKPDDQIPETPTPETP